MSTMEEGLATRIIREPSVRLVGRLTIDEAELSGFLEDEGVESWKTDTDVAAQKLVEVAGRLCYKSYAKPRPGGNAAYLGHILEVGHGSVIEHAVYNFIITGVSRSFTHELVRHRAGLGVLASGRSGSWTRRIARSSSPTRSPRTPSCTGSGWRPSPPRTRPTPGWPRG